MEIELANESETLDFGKQLAQRCQTLPLLIYLQGELGAGKTTLVRGFLQGLSYAGRVKSPTYTLVESYDIDEIQLFHFDFYRLHDPAELELIGIRDYFSKNAICLIEWPERAESILPTPDLRCRMTHFYNGRKIFLEAGSNMGQLILKGLKQYGV